MDPQAGRTSGGSKLTPILTRYDWKTRVHNPSQVLKIKHLRIGDTGVSFLIVFFPFGSPAAFKHLKVHPKMEDGSYFFHMFF